MRKPYVLTYDLGTQSVRAMIFDAEGNLLAKRKIKYEPYFSLKPGWAEQRAEV
ncbi:MAG: carbohydrate kinase, partial [Clostridiales bacterium]|nr:carbohydrate kinase [Clostridiales bacterium]